MYFFIYLSLNWGLNVFVISLTAWASLEAQMGLKFKMYDLCVVPSFNALIYRKCYKHFCCYFWQSQTEQLPVSPGGWAVPKNTALMKHLSVYASVCVCALKTMSERSKVKFAFLAHSCSPGTSAKVPQPRVTSCVCICVQETLDTPWCSLPVNKLNFGPYLCGVPIAGEQCGDLLQHLSPAFFNFNNLQLSGTTFPATSG